MFYSPGPWIWKLAKNESKGDCNDCNEWKKYLSAKIIMQSEGKKFMTSFTQQLTILR